MSAASNYPSGQILNPGFNRSNADLTKPPDLSQSCSPVKPTASVGKSQLVGSNSSHRLASPSAGSARTAEVSTAHHSGNFNSNTSRVSLSSGLLFLEQLKQSTTHLNHSPSVPFPPEPSPDCIRCPKSPECHESFPPPTSKSNIAPAFQPNMNFISEQLVSSIKAGNDLFLQKVSEICSKFDTLFCDASQPKQSSPEVQQNPYQESKYNPSSVDSSARSSTHWKDRRNSLPLSVIGRLSLHSSEHSMQVTSPTKPFESMSSPKSNCKSFQSPEVIPEEPSNMKCTSPAVAPKCESKQPLVKVKSPPEESKTTHHGTIESNGERVQIDRGKYFVLSDSFWNSLESPRNHSSPESSNQSPSGRPRRNSQDCCGRNPPNCASVKFDDSVERARKAIAECHCITAKSPFEYPAELRPRDPSLHSPLSCDSPSKYSLHHSYNA